eukprot:1322832-Prymnesium_polylepis.1
MSPAEQAAAQCFGYDAGIWDAGLAPEVCMRPWRQLNAGHMHAARELGYTQEAWDAELEEVVGQTAAPAASLPAWKAMLPQFNGNAPSSGSQFNGNATQGWGDRRQDAADADTAQEEPKLLAAMAFWQAVLNEPELLVPCADREGFNTCLRSWRSSSPEHRKHSASQAEVLYHLSRMKKVKVHPGGRLDWASPDSKASGPLPLPALPSSPTEAAVTQLLRKAGGSMRQADLCNALYKLQDGDVHRAALQAQGVKGWLTHAKRGGRFEVVSPSSGVATHQPTIRLVSATPSGVKPTPKAVQLIETGLQRTQSAGPVPNSPDGAVSNPTEAAILRLLQEAGGEMLLTNLCTALYKSAEGLEHRAELGNRNKGCGKLCRGGHSFRVGFADRTLEAQPWVLGRHAHLRSPQGADVLSQGSDAKRWLAGRPSLFIVRPNKSGMDAVKLLPSVASREGPAPMPWSLPAPPPAPTPPKAAARAPPPPSAAASPPPPQPVARMDAPPPAPTPPKAAARTPPPPSAAAPPPPPQPVARMDAGSVSE